MSRRRGNGKGSALNGAYSVGNYLGFRVQVGADGLFHAYDGEGAVVATGESYKALQAEVDKVQREASRDAFGSPDVVVVEDGGYRDTPKTVHVGKLTGLSQGGRLVLRVGSKRVTVKETAWIFRADQNEGIADELAAAMERVARTRAAVEEALEALAALLEGGHEYREYHARDTERSKLIDELREALA